MKKVLFLFRRDLRLEDNTGLIFALNQAEAVIPAFIFTPEQITDNPYRSDHCLKFMLECLEDLDEQLKKKGSRLYFFQGKPEEIVKKCILSLKIDGLVVNRDYTPYSRERDQKLEKVCKKHGVTFTSFDDLLLHPAEETVKKDGKPYTVFTPYFRNASKLEVLPPTPNRKENYFRGNIPFAKKDPVKKPSVENGIKGGRAEALKILRKLPSFQCSTHLSPYLKFTVCSPREVYAALPPNHPLIRSLYWRDFFTGIAWFFPYVFGGAFHQKFDKLSWSKDLKAFHRWCEGTTGVPIVDAAMREMNATGFMPNRQRMIVASFLIKDLHIDWRWGEKYFARNLIDYDPAVNNGNWQWVASTGCDAQPYFRVFNPWTQQKKFDPDCVYIKKWIPELEKFSSKAIHAWEKAPQPGYPSPMVSHDKESKKAIKSYKSI